MRDDAFYVGETGRRIRWTCTTSSAAHTGKRARNTALWCICATGGATSSHPAPYTRAQGRCSA
uniref:Uncharacterized protein n=1 Tax=Siphoviridae sp. ctW4q29 TaxID=2825535 RepID=A0A8S5TS09_9CAUD|nr:MAG TPA: hypothetical protein [Siphoviridae sp. ctW4q29]